MSQAQLIEYAAERNPEALVMDGFDDCIVGFCQHNQVLVYDVQKILAQHVANGMTQEEAVEFFEFNQAGAHFGEGTPLFLEMVTDADL